MNVVIDKSVIYQSLMSVVAVSIISQYDVWH